MNDVPATPPKPKKSVALSGVVAGNTALCTVGRTGNDLHYRGYDILDIAEQCEFEEIAHLLVHGKLPNRAELAAYKRKLQRMRGLPAAGAGRARGAARRGASDGRDAHRRVGARERCCRRSDDHDAAGARDIADRLLASLGSMLCYWYHCEPQRPADRRRDRRRLDRRPFPAPAARRGRRRLRSCARCTRRSTSTPSTSSTRRRSPRA